MKLVLRFFRSLYYVIVKRRDARRLEREMDRQLLKNEINRLKRELTR
jgi:hypothetical protein